LKREKTQDHAKLQQSIRRVERKKISRVADIPKRLRKKDMLNHFSRTGGSSSEKDGRKGTEKREELKNGNELPSRGRNKR